MMAATDDEAAKWKHIKEKAGGDACCSGGDLSPEQKICSLIPKLNEVIYEILSEAPYHRATMLVTPNGSIAIKQQALLESISSFTQKVLHNVHYSKSPRRSLTLKGEVKGLKVGETVRINDLVTFDVTVAKIPALAACCSHRLWLALINQTSREIQLMEFRQNLDKIE
jgi:hypothetical protein